MLKREAKGETPGRMTPGWEKTEETVEGPAEEKAAAEKGTANEEMAKQEITEKKRKERKAPETAEKELTGENSQSC